MDLSDISLVDTWRNNQSTEVIMEVERIEPLVQVSSELLVIGGGVSLSESVFIPLIEIFKLSNGEKLRTFKLTISPRMPLNSSSHFNLILKESSYNVAIIHS